MYAKVIHNYSVVYLTVFFLVWLVCNFFSSSVVLNGRQDKMPASKLIENL